MFLRNKKTDISGLLEKLPKPTPKEIIEKYKQTFSDLNGVIIFSF